MRLGGVLKVKEGISEYGVPRSGRTDGSSYRLRRTPSPQYKGLRLLQYFNPLPVVTECSTHISFAPYAEYSCSGYDSVAYPHLVVIPHSIVK